MDSNILHIRNLNKIYANGFVALKDVNLDIKKGEIFGLLGPNGAGKTTIINIVTGLSSKTSGEVLVMGKDPIKDFRFTRAKIGLVQQEINNDPFMKINEIVKIQGGYYGLTNLDSKVDDILRTVQLYDKRKSIGRHLSGGMKRRVMIAKALIHDPEIIFLDEPTAGVDVELRANLWEVIRNLRERGKTIILTTHYLEEAEELADRIAFINHGKILLVEDTKSLLARYGTKMHDIYLDIIQNGNSPP
ncbi:MAG: ABC transporter ATP-binding protein [Patescibacteria group bacterium]